MEQKLNSVSSAGTKDDSSTIVEDSVAVRQHNTNAMLGDGLIEYYVRWRHIPMDLYMTPLYLISVDHTVVKAKKDATNYDIMKSVANEFPIMNFTPDEISIESFQPFA